MVGGAEAALSRDLRRGRSRSSLTSIIPLADIQTAAHHRLLRSAQPLSMGHPPQRLIKERPGAFKAAGKERASGGARQAVDRVLGGRSPNGSVGRQATQAHPDFYLAARAFQTSAIVGNIKFMTEAMNGSRPMAGEILEVGLALAWSGLSSADGAAAIDQRSCAARAAFRPSAVLGARPCPFFPGFSRFVGPTASTRWSAHQRQSNAPPPGRALRPDRR